MKEVFGNLWTYPAAIRVITTNGDVNKAGLAVMGRGVALQAAQRWPDIRLTLALFLKEDGNHVHNLGSFGMRTKWFNVWSFPVKHHWYERADGLLIARSAQEAVAMADAMGWDAPIVLPRPGCGNGQLQWKQVRPWIEGILDDRFHVIDRPVPQ